MSQQYSTYFKPAEIKSYIIKRKWWFNKTEYWVEWEFVRTGPFKSHNEALEILQMYDVSIKL